MAIDTVNALTTLVDVKAWVGVNTTDYDTILENYIDSVSWQFNKFTDRLLKARDITDQYDGDGSTVMLLPEYPINEIISIFIDNNRAFGAETAVTDYVFYSDGTIKLDTNTFTTTAKGNKIIYNAGYETLPFDLVMACKDQIKWLYRRHRNNQEGIASITSMNGETTMTEQGEILKTSLEILKRYIKRDHM